MERKIEKDDFKTIEVLKIEKNLSGDFDIQYDDNEDRMEFIGFSNLPDEYPLTSYPPLKIVNLEQSLLNLRKSGAVYCQISLNEKGYLMIGGILRPSTEEEIEEHFRA